MVRWVSPILIVFLSGVLLCGCLPKSPRGVATQDLQADVPFMSRLTSIVEKAAPPVRSRNTTIRAVQKEFESHFFSASKRGEFQIENIGLQTHKWLDSYAYHSANPEQSLERFDEFILSAILVKKLMNPSGVTPILASDTGTWRDRPGNEVYWPQTTGMNGQDRCVWLDKQGCRSHMDKLYEVQTHPTNLYEELQQVSKKLAAQDGRRSRIMVLGYEIPWDDAEGIRYGVSFYFEDVSWEENFDTFREEENRSTFLGYEVLYTNESTPRPRVHGDPTQELTSLRKPVPWHKRAWRMTGYPIAFIIGIKNSIFEVAKMPFSFIAGGLFGRGAPWDYSLQNLQTAYDSLEIELTHPPRYGLLLGIHRLITEIPLVGQIFQYNIGAHLREYEDDGCRADESIPCPRQKIFVSRGIYGGDQWAQDTGLWSAFTQQVYPQADVYAPPYRFGTVTDVIWSMFNLSHGPGYNEAQYIIQHAGKADRIYLAGHSGGVQRSAAASRILADHGYRVAKIVGIAGPSIGQAFVDTRYQDPFRVYLNKDTGANDDVVSQIGAVANVYSGILDNFVIGPMKYSVGMVARLFDVTGIFGKNLQRWVYDKADHTGFTNSDIVEVERKPSSRHETPFRLSLSDRLIFDAYVRSEFATAFREDLQGTGHHRRLLDSMRPFEWRR